MNVSDYHMEKAYNQIERDYSGYAPEFFAGRIYNEKEGFILPFSIAFVSYLSNSNKYF